MESTSTVKVNEVFDVTKVEEEEQGQAEKRQRECRLAIFQVHLAAVGLVGRMPLMSKLRLVTLDAEA